MCAFILCIVFGIALYGAMVEIRALKAERLNLLAELCHVKSTLTMHSNSKLTVVLTLPERRMILDALESPRYKDRVTNPKTKKYIRMVYHAAVFQMKKSIKDKDGQVKKEQNSPGGI